MLDTELTKHAETNRLLAKSNKSLEKSHRKFTIMLLIFSLVFISIYITDSCSNKSNLKDKNLSPLHYKEPNKIIQKTSTDVLSLIKTPKTI